MRGKMKTNTVHACHSVAFGYVTKFPCSFRFFENSSMFPLAYAKILRYFAHSKLRFVELSLAFLNFRFSTHFFESSSNFRRKIHEISFKISLKIRENKGRISLSLLLHSTVTSQYFFCVYLLYTFISSLWFSIILAANSLAVTDCWGRCCIIDTHHFFYSFCSQKKFCHWPSVLSHPTQFLAVRR